MAAGLSDEELTWRMETAKPEANAYRIASAALEKAESTYERFLWRQVRPSGWAMRYLVRYLVYASAAPPVDFCGGVLFYVARLFV